MHIYSRNKRVKGPYNFNYALTHYNIYPWFRENDKLCRILRMEKNTIVKAELTSQGKLFNTKLQITIKSVKKLPPPLLKKIMDKISWCLFLEDNYKDHYEICKDDPILNAAVKEKNYGRGKLFPVIFEGMISVIVSQNTTFSRIYAMMKNLSFAFGDWLLIEENEYHAFPRAKDIAYHSLDDIRKCKVGYRDKYIKGVAKKIVDENINLEGFRDLNNESLRKELIEFPGIGSYSANLIMGVAFKRNTYHLDSFVRKIIQAAYFDGKDIKDDEIIEFIENRWGKHAGFAIDALTTNTEVWAKKMGIDIGGKSGAKSD